MAQEGDLSKQSAQIVDEMSLKEKVAFCSGKNFWYLKSLDRLELPSIMVTLSLIHISEPTRPY